MSSTAVMFPPASMPPHPPDPQPISAALKRHFDEELAQIQSGKSVRVGAAVTLAGAQVGIGFTYHYISQQSDETPGMDGQGIAAMIPQTPDFRFRNAGTGGACVVKFTGWDKIRTCDNGKEAYAVAYGQPDVERTITWANGWTDVDVMYETMSVALYRARR